MLKKIMVVGMALVMLFSLAACKGKEETETETAVGTFYTLQEAYDQGLLTVDDLQLIASKPNNEVLDAEVERAIKETSASVFRSEVFPDGSLMFPEAKADDFTISKYYGTYNGCVAIMLTDIYTGYTQALWDVTIAGVTFYYNDGNSIVIWKAKS